MKVQCCVCHKLREGDQWKKAQPGETSGERISHGYCPKCAAQAFQKIRRKPRFNLNVFKAI